MARIATEARVVSVAKPAAENRSSAEVIEARQQAQQAQAQKAAEQQEVSRQQVDDAVSNLNDFVQNIRRDLSFQVDEEAGEVIVQVTDYQTGEMIRQIPSEEALELAERLSEARSLLFEAKA
ncbi:flagellar biosynthesis protein FlaG [Aestuariirhabdus litorea]|uniref:Flagellar biosynthesis protein FlaG n=2 Tax=Aestuariirhabdus litorea TaxID=2528527 RepID=A0A3P3VXT1_9GAMM|nr:flagellar biosynthesis protein FlaG [Aestuariirhabdus litorea]RWW98702.1 flagellar protein FlaG [Endozoicomonadaceae bacterium GTF-13]